VLKIEKGKYIEQENRKQEENKKELSPLLATLTLMDFYSQYKLCLTSSIFMLLTMDMALLA